MGLPVFYPTVARPFKPVFGTPCCGRCVSTCFSQGGPLRLGLPEKLRFILVCCGAAKKGFHRHLGSESASRPKIFISLISYGCAKNGGASPCRDCGHRFPFTPQFGCAGVRAARSDCHPRGRCGRSALVWRVPLQIHGARPRGWFMIWGEKARAMDTGPCMPPPPAPVRRTASEVAGGHALRCRRGQHRLRVRTD